MQSAMGIGYLDVGLCHVVAAVGLVNLESSGQQVQQDFGTS